MSSGLPGFTIGIMFANFWMFGSLLWSLIYINVDVRNWMATGSRCIMWMLDILSGPAGSEFLSDLSFVSVVVGWCMFCGLFSGDSVL